MLDHGDRCLSDYVQQCSDTGRSCTEHSKLPIILTGSEDGELPSVYLPL